MAGEEIERQDVEALLETRRELGPSYDEALVDSFAHRIERAVDERVSQEVAARAHRHGVDQRKQVQQFVLGIISLVAAIPISIVLGLNDELFALVVAWAGIVAVNTAHALSFRERPPGR